LRTLVIDNSLTRFYLRGGAATSRCLPEPARMVHGVRDRLPAPGDFDRLIVTGSEASATANDDWIRRQADLIAETAGAGKAVLGICFGHQLLARALWGKEHVRRSPTPEIGWYEMTLDVADPLFADLPRTAPWYCSHFDEVIDLPLEARVLARSDRCGVEAFRAANRPVWGLQFHPEYFGLHGALLLASMRVLHRSLTVPTDLRVPAAAAAARARRLFAEFWRLTS